MTTLNQSWPPNAPIDAELKRLACAFCGTRVADRIYGGLLDVRYGNSGTFGIVRCPSCGLCWLDPRPDPANVLDFYNGSRYVPFQDRRESRSRLRAVARSALSVPYEMRYGEIDSISGGRGRAMLDIGCGTGHRLEAMGRAGWLVYGIEVDRDAAALAADRAGGRGHVLTGSVMAARFPAESFDLITLSHVLEHLYNPVSALRLIHQWLRPDGELVLWVPNFGSLERRIFGRHWAALDVPRHVTHFSLGTLSTALQIAGFCVRSWRPQLQGSSLVTCPG